MTGKSWRTSGKELSNDFDTKIASNCVLKLLYLVSLISILYIFGHELPNPATSTKFIKVFVIFSWVSTWITHKISFERTPSHVLQFKAEVRVSVCRPDKFQCQE